MPNQTSKAETSAVGQALKSEQSREEALIEFPTRDPVTTALVFLCFHLVYVILPLAFTLAPFVLLYSGNVFMGTAWIGFYVRWLVISMPSEKDLGRPWPWFENLPLFSFLFGYFPFGLTRAKPMRHHKTDPAEHAKLDPKGLYVFGVHPHGALAFNRGMFGFSTRTLWNKAFPGIDFRVLTATAALRVPLIREMWLWSSCIDASKQVARKALEKRVNLLLYPGGEREQMMTQRGKHRLFLKNRKGFVKLAIEAGAELVPVYVFGETDLFEHSSFLLDARVKIMKNFGVAIPLIYGQAGLLPFAASVTAVVGPALEVKQSDNPSNEEVDEVHTRYVAALVALFEENKAAYGCSDAILEIE